MLLAGNKEGKDNIIEAESNVEIKIPIVMSISEATLATWSRTEDGSWKEFCMQ